MNTKVKKIEMIPPKDATHVSTVTGLFYKVGVFGFMSVWSDWLEMWSETPHHINDYSEGELEPLDE